MSAIIQNSSAFQYLTIERIHESITNPRQTLMRTPSISTRLQIDRIIESIAA
jgi:hypothetical protein